MGRRKDEHYWNQVTKEENGTLKCKHCGHKFKGGVSRIKAHVDRIQGQGISVCSINHDNGIHNCIASCSNDPQGVANAMNPMEGWALVHAVTRSGNSAFGSNVSHLNELLHDLTCEEGDIKGQLEWLESRGKKCRRQVDIWLNQVQRLKNKAVHIKSGLEIQQCSEEYSVDLGLNYGRETQQLTEEVRKHKAEKPVVLSIELVGKNFEENVKKIWELLGDDQVFIIGIHGMGGVGKTCLATHMENEMKRKKTFKHVFWVTVSHNYSILKLQDDIAKRIGIELSVDDVRIRAASLSLALESKEKPVLILDDIWKYIDLQKVGIPLKVNGIKLILTSRLEHVCRQMDCLSNNIIRMHPLSYNEGLELFLLKLGRHGGLATLPLKVKEIAESIVRECDGLPLGINVMARTMKKVNGIHQWSQALNKLQNLTKGEETEEVFEILKLSYDNLMEKEMQNCFLHCALCCGRIDRAELMLKLVEAGIINGTWSLREIFDKGHTILDQLKDHSLLWENDGSILMHGLVRNMAYHILRESHKYMVKWNMQLKKMPHMQEWTIDLEVVSLNVNHIEEEIPTDISPHCPRLSTFIFTYSFINRIPERFFTHMSALTVLDLSMNRKLRYLPDSLSNLTSLISLVLRGCSKLKHLPPMGALQALSRLDISNTSVEEVQGLEILIKLKWLDLSHNGKLKRFKLGSVLRRLTNLQYLDLCRAGSIKIKVEDVQEMSMLECFRGSFHDCESYNSYMKKFQNEGYKSKTYHLLSGIESEKFWKEYPEICIVPEDDDCQIVVFGDCEESLHLLPLDLAKLCIHSNHQWTCLCDALSFSGHSYLTNIDTIDCTELESLFCLSGKCSFCTNLKNLESLHLDYLASLSDICKEDVANGALNGVFSRLKHLNITNCDGIETVLTPWLLSLLQNLETINVSQCRSVIEIFAVSNSDNDDGSNSSSRIKLPKLTRLELINLPRLETVCKGVLVCESLPKLRIDRCPNSSIPTIQVFP